MTERSARFLFLTDFAVSLPIPKKCRIGTICVRLLSDNGRKQAKMEKSRKHPTHRVFIIQVSSNTLKEFKN